MYRKILVGGLTAAAIVGGGTAALATTGSDLTTGTPTAGSSSAANSTSAPTTPGKHGAKHKGGLRGALLRRAVHGSVVVKTKKGFQTIDFARGSVTAVSASSISVQSPDKTTETFAVTNTTKVRTRTPGTKGKGATSTISKVTEGDRVVVLGTGSSTKTATRVVDLGKK